MPAQYTYPGVYVQEVPGGSRAIVGVATAVTAFVGRALRGPVEEPVTIFSYGEFERVFGGLWKLSGLGYAVRDYFRNGGGTALVVRLAPQAAHAQANVAGLELQALHPGAWGNELEVVVSHPTDAEAELEAEARGVAADSLYQLVVTDTATRFQEEFPLVSAAGGGRDVRDVLRTSQAVRVTGTPPLARPPAGTYEFRTAARGKDGDALRAEDYLGGGTAAKDGMYALEKADLFTLLCLPPPALDSDIAPLVWGDALTYCWEKRAFLVMDPPLNEGGTPEGVQGWLDGLGLNGPARRNGALYFPRIRVADPLRGGVVGDFAPCGAVAGVMARTDTSRGVWKAPAGVDAGIAGASGLKVSLTDGEQGRLNPKGINCLRVFRDVGSVVWGARTLRGADVLADEYKYVPVRRLALFLEESLFRGSQWVVFEPNDEPLWAQIRTSLGAFMQDLFRQGAFQGSSPRDAYFVKCDAETNTQYDIDRGIVNIHVGFAPLKPAEFVVISIQQKTAGSPA